MVSAMPSMPEVRTVWRTSTASNQPQRRLRPGDDAEFLALLADQLADLVEQLGRERPLADAGRVGLGDAEHVADGARAEARAGRGLAGDGVGGGDERIGAVVDVEQRALRALEQDALAGAALVVEQAPDGVHVGQHLRRDRGELLVDRLGRRTPRAQSRGAAHCDASAAGRSFRARLPRSARSMRRIARRPTLSS